MVDIVVKHSQNPLFFTLFEYLHSQIFFFSHWLSVDNSRNKRVSVFFFVMLHWFWNKNWFVLDQTYFFENKELLTITRNTDTHLYNSVSWNAVQIFKVVKHAVLVLVLWEHDNLWFYILILLLVHHQNSPGTLLLI